jgi:hypothetical protein
MILSSCNFLRNNDNDKVLTKEHIEDIIAGKDTSTPSLLILYDKKLPPPGKANRVDINTIKYDGKEYYSVLAEYTDTLYNRFAIIDENLNVILLDKSLSGHLAENILQTADKQFIKIEEDFISKDTLGLKRISLYNLVGSGEAVLAFRTYTELKEPGVTYSQEILKMTLEEIITKISSTDRMFTEMIDSSDNFVFDSAAKKYISVESRFDSFVLNLVTNNTSINLNPSEDSNDPSVQQSENITSNDNSRKFSIPLSSQWDEIQNVKVTYLMKKMVIGTKYINNQYGAEITVIQLPGNDSSENYINYKLENISSGNYKVRYSDKVADGIYYYQFFEYSCSGEKFLLILQTLKSTYETYRSEYQNLINSFSMGC